MAEEMSLWGETLERREEKKGGIEGSMKRLKPIDRRQCFWGAIDVEKLIPEDHSARGIWAMVMQLELRALEEKIRAVEGRAGQSSFDPRLLMALWIYGYSEGISSARELSRMCDYEPGCQWLTGMQSINHHSLSDFRVDHKKELDRLFVRVLGLLSAEGLIEMKRITQDGTKVRAHASSRSFRRKERIREHLQFARKHVEALSRLESEELRQRMIAARKRSAQEKQQRLEAALQELQQLEQTRSEAERPEVRVSETDPQARIMKQADGGFGVSYNMQISTDAAHGLIVAVDVTQAGNDCDQLVGAIDQVEANTGKRPEQLLVDGGYTMKNANIDAMTERDIDVIGPIGTTNSEASLKRRGIEPPFYPEQFHYDPVADTLTCPAGKQLQLLQSRTRDGRVEYSYRASVSDCQVCPFQGQCCPKNSPRMVMRTENSPAVEAFRTRMATEDAKQLYRSRAQIAEFPHAWIKEKLGLRRFRLRGLEKVRVEAIWACLTYNIQQWLRLVWKPRLQTAA